MTRPATIGSLLILITSALIVSVHASGMFESSRANEAMDRYTRSVQLAAEDFDKKVRNAREACIRELKSAESAASRMGDDQDARKIREQYEALSRLQDLPTQLPKPLVPPGVALADSQFLLTNGVTWHFLKDGTSVGYAQGRKTGEGRWEPLGPNAATVRFAKFYAIAFDLRYEQCFIRGEGFEYQGKRVK